MERRLLLVFALTFLVIILFQPLLKKYLPQPAAHMRDLALRALGGQRLLDRYDWLYDWRPR